MGLVRGFVRRAFSTSAAAFACVVAAVALAGCPDISLSASYNPLTNIVTVTGSTKNGKSKTQTIDNPVIKDGCITINDERCGKTTICGITSASRVTVTCSDPLLAQVPAGWTGVSGTWTLKDGTTGKLTIGELADFEVPGSVGLKLEPNTRGLVIEAEKDFPQGFEGTLTVSANTGGTDATGVQLKGFDVITARVYDAGGNLVGKPFVVTPDGSPPLDFAANARYSTAVKQGTATGTVDRKPVCGGCAASGSPRSGLAEALLLAGVVLYLRRRWARWER